MSLHPSHFLLHRLHAGERDFPGAEEARAHAASCVACARVLRGHADAQAEFESAVSFERFAAGVERAAQAAPRRAGVPLARRIAPLAAMAAVALVGVSVAPRLGREAALNRIKGGEVAELRIAGADGGHQRVATPGELERLAPGERVRLGYAGDDGYVLAVSVDAAGVVSALYPEAGESLAVERGGEGIHYLPDSLEFTGTGVERVILVRSARPLTVQEVLEAAGRAFAQAGGDVSSMGALDVPGEQTRWLLVKP